MPVEIAEALAMMTTLIATGSLILIGIRMRLGHKERMARLQAGTDDGREDAAIEKLQHQVETLSEEVAELNERMDFTERLLTQGRQANAKQGGVTTPL